MKEGDINTSKWQRQCIPNHTVTKRSIAGHQSGPKKCVTCILPVFKHGCPFDNIQSPNLWDSIIILISWHTSGPVNSNSGAKQGFHSPFWNQWNVKVWLNYAQCLGWSWLLLYPDTEMVVSVFKIILSASLCRTIWGLDCLWREIYLSICQLWHGSHAAGILAHLGPISFSASCRAGGPV